MKSFAGFPRRMQFTPLPNLFFSELLPEIDDVAELKVTLHIFQALYQKRGYPRFVTYGELIGDRALVAGVGDSVAIRRGLDLAASRGTILRLAVERAGIGEELFFLNTEADRLAVDRIMGGELDIGAVPKPEPVTETEQRRNIFALYEENIGMLTPIIAEELKDAESLYPASWIEDAFREAVGRNKRNWRYISKILERWRSEGKGDGEHRRYPREDRDKYIKGRYGHLVQR